MTKDQYFDNTGFQQHKVVQSAEIGRQEIGFKMTPPDACNFKRKNSSAKFIMTTFVLQTRLEMLQRALFRERLDQQKDLFSAHENEILDNFHLHLMGRANKTELFEIQRQLLQDDYNYKDIVVADFIEEHERIKFDRQETSYLHQEINNK